MRTSLLLCVLLLGTLSAPARAQPAAAVFAGPGPGARTPKAGPLGPAVPPGLTNLSIPDPLRPWVGWVLYDHETELCPPLHGVEDEGHRCVWPTSLALSMDDKGGRFTGRFSVFRRGFVTLPGDATTWPQDVRVDGQPAVVSSQGEDDDERPAVLLTPGDHTVTGVFLLDELPESLAVPSDTGLLQLTVQGERLALPIRDDEGRVFLRREAAEKEEDVLEVTVHRLLEDGVPIELTTRIDLRVSGKGREVQLARALPAGFTPMRLDSPLPARLEQDGHLRVQVRAGSHTLTLVARHDGPVSELTLPSPDGPFAAAEIWAFKAAPSLRVVTVEGVPAIDPQQTTLPDAWRRLPCYPMKPGDVLRLREQRRGDADPAPDRLQLRRQLWLDFDGAAFTAHDRLSGTVHRSTRLEVDPPLVLGRVAVDGQDQLITSARPEDGGRTGVEIRQGEVSVEADLRIPRSGPGLPASGWRGDLHGMQADLHLPPGWRLLYASGADEVSETWARRWSLLDLFLMLILTMAFGRLYGARAGALALLTLALCLPEEGAPRWAWPPVLACAALLRLLPEGRLRTALRAALIGAQVVLVLVCVGFAAQHLRRSLYPALERDSEVTLLDLPSSREAAPSGSVDAPDEDAEEPEKEKVQAQMAAPMQQSLRKMKAPAPKTPPAKRDDLLQGLVGDAGGGGGADNGLAERKEAPSAGKRFSSLVQRKGYMYQQQLQQLDPRATVQTGPGLPGWRWTSIPVRFSGPVEAGQWLRLYLIPPQANLLLGLLRVALLALLLLRALGLLGRVPWLRALLPLLPLYVLLTPGAARAADLPGDALLDALRARLLKPAECQPRCAASQRLSLEVSGGVLRLRLSVGAAAATAVPLPGEAAQWLPAEVLLDGRPAAALRSEDGRLWLQLTPGNHEVLLGGPLPDRDTVQLGLPLKPHRVDVRARGWRVDGVHEDGTADDDLQLSRERREPRDGKATLEPEALPPFVIVERELRIDVKWQVETRARRVTPAGVGALLEVPLLPGESVTTPEVRVRGGKALVNLAPGATEVVWRSLLQEHSPLVLRAAAGGPFVERWRLDLSPLWHAELQGIPAVHGGGGAGARRPEWRPWPGEEVRIALSRPPAVPGQSLTIDRSKLVLRPGLRATDATLELRLRASRGGQHTLLLPAGAALQGVSVDGDTQPLRPDGGRVLLPVHPGAQTIELSWREGRGIAPRFVTSQVELGAKAVNATIEVRPGGDRWVLLCGGPRLGPAVLFWGMALVIGLLALVLGRVRITPLRGRDWLLLSLGLMPLGVVPGALVLGFWLALGWRRERAELPRRWLFNLRQVALVLWAAAAAIALLSAIHEGLLGYPEMRISGNGSSETVLRWFADHADGALPRAWVVSLPLWAYRVAMLLWALWLARALLRWLRWGYGALGEGGLWRREAPPAPPPEGAEAQRSNS